MKLLKVFKNILSGLYKSIKRFPVTIGLTTSVAVMLIIITHNEGNFTGELRDNLNRIAMILALGVPLSLCIKLIFEKCKNSSLVYKDNSNIEKLDKTPEYKVTIYKFMAYLIAAAALVLYYFFLLPDFGMVSITRYIAFNIALYLGFFFIPYLSKRSNFELYVIKLISQFFITLIYSGVLYGGLSAIMFTLDKLLSVPIQGRYYYYVWLVIAGVFAPTYFLGGLPATEHILQTSNYSKPLKILLLYIVMPIITVYTAILYVYFVKILITLQWPVGMVAHLVIWYSIISTGVIFLISPLIEGNKWVKNFIFWFTKLVIPIMIMMFVSLGIRINAYGITENRYYVMVMGLWVLSMMIYTSFTHAKKNIILPVSLALVAVLSISGPWSSYSVSKFSQNKRFEAILTRNGMLRDNEIIKSETEVSNKDKIEVSEILSYFERNHQLSDIKYLPTDFKMENTEHVFGFPYHFNTYDKPLGRFFAYNASDWSKPVNIAGFDYLIDFRSLYSEAEPIIDNMRIKYDIKNTYFSILIGDEEIYSKILSDFGKQLYDKFGMVDKQRINPEEMCFVEENDKVKLKFIFFGMYGEKDLSSDSININSMEFYILIKVK
jgi:hypothetical protein